MTSEAIDELLEHVTRVEPQRRRSKIERGDNPPTMSYVLLSFAWGHARLGGRERCAALGRQAGELLRAHVHNTVHAAVASAYLERIHEVGGTGISLDFDLRGGERSPIDTFRIERVFQGSRILDPSGEVDAFVSWDRCRYGTASEPKPYPGYHHFPHPPKPPSLGRWSSSHERVSACMVFELERDDDEHRRGARTDSPALAPAMSLLRTYSCANLTNLNSYSRLVLAVLRNLEWTETTEASEVARRELLEAMRAGLVGVTDSYSTNRWVCLSLLHYVEHMMLLTLMPALRSARR